MYVQANQMASSRHPSFLRVVDTLHSFMSRMQNSKTILWGG